MKYSELVTVYEKLENTSKRLEKTFIISKFLKQIDKDIDKIMLLLNGRVFPGYDNSKLGVASKIVLKAIQKASGRTENEILNYWKKHGDLGLVAAEMIKTKSQSTLFSSALTVSKVYNNIKKLPQLEGSGSIDRKIALMAQLLTSSKPAEAKYIVRTVLEEMRFGVGKSSLRDAIVWAYFSDDLKISYDQDSNDMQIEDRDKYNKYTNATQKAIDLTNDIPLVAKKAKQGFKQLTEIGIIIGNPILVMLSPKVQNIKKGFERVGKPCQIEYKYDGFRMQIHKKEKIKIFTRRLENVTNQFPHIVEYVKKNVKGKNFIIEGEAVGFDPDTKDYQPFQKISQRIRRKYNIKKTAEEFPVELNLFDVIYYNGEQMLEVDFEKRRKLLEKITNQVDKKIVLSKKIITSDTKKVEKFYGQALKDEQEGVMMKNLNAPYKPGSRVGYMVKLKPTMESLDLVIVGAEWGKGKRSGWLTSYTLSCVGEDEQLLTIGKSSTGLKEKSSEGLSFEQITNMLKPLIISEKNRSVKVKPEIIIEINYQEIQKSPTYNSGYALRFPSISKLRDDRGLADASTLNEVEELYKSQNK
ncbi:MAG: DNA ligase [Candidatus Woesearchaeota archaeon]|nr:DNA ligase [Candidatus Woesearchaeota archaeon]